MHAVNEYVLSNYDWLFDMLALIHHVLMPCSEDTPLLEENVFCTLLISPTPKFM